MILFGIQDRLNRFNKAHTFGVFVKVQDNGNDPRQYTLIVKLISWLPAKGDGGLFGRAEEGRNHQLAESLSVPAADGRSITQWGPVEIEQELFERAAKQSDDLDNHRFLYKARDERLRKRGIALNCEHAVSDIDTDRGLLATGIAHGTRGSRMVARHLQRWVVGPLEREDLGWLENCLELSQFPTRKGKW